MGVDQMGVDQMGVDQMGVDQMGRHRLNILHCHTYVCLHATAFYRGTASKQFFAISQLTYSAAPKLLSDQIFVRPRRKRRLHLET